MTAGRPVGFLINPIAGLGGRVGLKGTDDVVEEALRRGAEPSAAERAGAMLEALSRALSDAPGISAPVWLTCSGAMGAEALAKAGFTDARIVHESGASSDANDTRRASRRFLEAGAGIVVFCGGDGTARDICEITGRQIPILGIPAGVKMYSGVFATTPARAAEILIGFLAGDLTASEVEVLDLDEERYRRGEWAVRLYRTALTPYEPTMTQHAKMLIDETTDAEVKEEIAHYLAETIRADPEALYILGPGSTVAAIAQQLGLDKTLLGIDAAAGGAMVGRDLDERAILALLDRYPRRHLVLSPIGAQGFVLGRGNLQLSPAALRRIGRDAIVLAATPAKLARTRLLRVDTGDPELDAAMIGPGYFQVVVGNRRRRMVKAVI